MLIQRTKSVFLTIVLTTSLLCSACSNFEPPRETPKVINTSSTADGAMDVTFLGNSTILLDDGKSVIMIDGFITRHCFLKTLLGKIETDKVAVTTNLTKAGISTIDAVVVPHSHFDHVLDAPFIARTYDAQLIGSESTMQIANSWLGDDIEYTFNSGVHAANSQQKNGNFEHQIGDFRIVLEKVAYHNPLPLRAHKWLLHGNVSNTVDFSKKQRFNKFKEGGSYNVYVEHPLAKFYLALSAPDSQLYIGQADILFASAPLIKTIEKQPKTRHGQCEGGYWRLLNNRLKDITLVPVHWDSFFRTLDKPSRPGFGISRTLKNLDKIVRQHACNAQLVWMLPHAKFSVEGALGE